MVFEVLLSAPDTGVLEEQAVLAAMRSGWVAPAGPDLAAFERQMATRVGVEHAVALSSGTAGLHLALVAWGVGPGDVIPVSTLTFAATVNAIKYVGATPYFVDCDEESGNMNPALLRDGVDRLLAAGHRVPAIVPVDLLGKCVDHESIEEVAFACGAKVLSDAAESLGASRNRRPAGSWGDAAVVSFNGNKIMTTSGGGMLLTDDERLAVHVRKLSTQAREPVVHYEHTEVGFNYRLSNLLAALGGAQLTRLDTMIARRREWRTRYRRLFADYPGIRILGGAHDGEDNCWLTSIVLEPGKAPVSPAHLMQGLRLAGIESRPIWKPMHLQPVFADLSGALDGTSERLFTRGVSLPSGSGMSDEQFAHVSSTLGRVVRGALT